jgi:hypothetical protein
MVVKISADQINHNHLRHLRFFSRERTRIYMIVKIVAEHK